MKPVEVDNTQILIGLSGNISRYLPDYKDVPEDFKRDSGEAQKWCNIVRDFFYCGVIIKSVVMKDGIDKKLALGHVMAVLRSFEPKHEHKIAGVAYLMSLWFDNIIYETLHD